MYVFSYILVFYRVFLLILDTPIVPVEESRRFILECLVAVGTPKEHAKAMADLLVEADHRGHYSHGMNRLGKTTIPQLAFHHSTISHLSE